MSRYRGRHRRWWRRIDWAETVIVGVIFGGVVLWITLVVVWDYAHD